MAKTVSVIIPAYNINGYLAECFYSVTNQTYKDLEIIIVDDGSNDGTEKTADLLSKTDYRSIVYHKKNGGLSNARNFGLQHSKGEYVYFLDGDDVLTADAIEKLVFTAETNLSDFVFFEAESFTDDSISVNQNYVIKHKYSTDTGENVFESLIENSDFHSSVPLLFFKRKFLFDCNLCFPENLLYEDMLFTFKAYFCATKVTHLHEQLYRRRYRTGSIMTSKKNCSNFNSAYKIYCELLHYSKDKGISNKFCVKKYISRNALNIFDIYDALSVNDKNLIKTDFRLYKENIKNNKQNLTFEVYLRSISKSLWILWKIKNKLSK